MGRFDTKWLTALRQQRNLPALTNMGLWTTAFAPAGHTERHFARHGCKRQSDARRIGIGHLELRMQVLSPLFLPNQFGDLERCVFALTRKSQNRPSFDGLLIACRADSLPELWRPGAHL